MIIAVNHRTDMALSLEAFLELNDATFSPDEVALLTTLDIGQTITMPVAQSETFTITRVW